MRPRTRSRVARYRELVGPGRHTRGVSRLSFVSLRPGRPAGTPAGDRRRVRADRRGRAGGGRAGLRHGLVRWRRPGRRGPDGRPGGGDGTAHVRARVARPGRSGRAGRAGAHRVGHGDGLAGSALGPRAGPDLELPRRGGPAPRHRRGSGVADLMGADRRAPAARRPPAARAEHRRCRTRSGRRPGGCAAAHRDTRRLGAARPPADGRPPWRDGHAGHRVVADRAVDHRADDHGRRRAHPGRPRLHRRRPARRGLPDGEERDPRPARRAVHHLRAAAGARCGVRAPGPARGPHGARPAARRRARLVGRGGRRRGRHGRHARRGGPETRDDGRDLAGPRRSDGRRGRRRADPAAGDAGRGAAVDRAAARGRPERCRGRRRGARPHRPLPAWLDVQDRDGAGRGRAGRALGGHARWRARGRP